MGVGGNRSLYGVGASLAGCAPYFANGVTNSSQFSILSMNKRSPDFIPYDDILRFSSTGNPLIVISPSYTPCYSKMNYLAAANVPLAGRSIINSLLSGVLANTETNGYYKEMRSTVS